MRVREAIKLLDERKVSFSYDGEIQLDAALVPSVTDKKAPGSPIRGKVNTLVFPDLGAGNIGDKLVQPLSDLSRGCSVEDIVTTAAVTLVQAGKK